MEENSCYNTYTCKCPRCGRQHYFTFKHIHPDLIVDKKGFIEFKCMTCYRRTKNK